MPQNPFIDLSDNPFATWEPGDVSSTEIISIGPTCGDPSCVRKHRPADSISPGAHYSPDASIRAKELSEDGKFGGQFGHLSAGRSARSKRAAEIVAEYAVEAAPEIRKAFADGLHHTQPLAVRQSTALNVLGIEKDERALQLKEEAQALAQMTKGELVQDILGGLAALAKAQEIADGIVDATFVEMPDDDDDD